jgi:hypothetical protein
MATHGHCWPLLPNIPPAATSYSSENLSITAVAKMVCRFEKFEELTRDLFTGPGVAYITW